MKLFFAASFLTCLSICTNYPASAPAAVTSAFIIADSSRDWTGSYTFSELGDPNSGAFRVYQILIFQEGSGYTAEININGFQTAAQFTCNIQQINSDRIAFSFRRYGEEHFTLKKAKEGDLLLEIAKGSDGRMQVIWGKIEPLLPKNRGVFVPEDLEMQ